MFRLASLLLLIALPALPQGVVRVGEGSVEGFGEQSTGGTNEPVYVSGKVVSSSGDPLPTETAVEVTCGGLPKARDYLNPKGEFDIDLSGGSQGTVDATRSNSRSTGLPGRNHLGVVNLNGCIVRAELAGYESSEIALGMNSIFDNPNIGEIVLTRLEGITGDTISATSLSAPSGAVKLYDKAKKESQKAEPKPEKIVGWLKSAVKTYPEYAAAWELLGRAQLSLGRNDDALTALEKAVEADPRFIAPYPNLVKLITGTGDMPRVVETGRHALALNPHLHQVRFFVTAALLRQGDNDGTIESGEQMVEMGSAQRFPQAYQLLGAAYANKQNYKTSAENFRKFLELSPNATAAPRIQQQLDQWSQLGVI